MTGNNCLLDTSIIIHSFKDKQIAQQLDAYSQVFIPAIAIGELYYGAYRSANIPKHLNQVKDFIENCTVIVADSSTAKVYGIIKSTLKGKGKPIPENDIWIAAIALQYELPLFTTDKHFALIDHIILI